MKRRSFLKGAGLISLAGLTGVNTHGMLPAAGAEKRVRLSVNAYSFNQALRSGDMDFYGMMKFAAEAGLDAVDLTSYYFNSYPEPPLDKELFDLKREALRLGLDISWTGVRNNFVTMTEESRQADLDHIQAWMKASSKLGAPIMRIFAGKGEHPGLSRSQVKEQLVENFKICAEHGRRNGVIAGLQPHNDFLYTSEEIIEILEEVDSEWFGMVLDSGSLRTDPYKEIERLLPYANYWFIKSTVYTNGVPEPVNMQKIAGIIERSDYQGYISFESLRSEDPARDVERMIARFKGAYGG